MKTVFRNLLIILIVLAAVATGVGFFHSRSPVRQGSTHIIYDQTGRKVQIPMRVNRVVTSMYPIATQIVFMLGAQDCLAGISDYDVNGVMKRIYPAIERIPRPTRSAGQEIGVEEILKLKPDLVFTHFRSNVDALSALGIPSVCLRLESPDALIEGILLTGKIMNREDRARQIVQYYRQKLSEIRKRTETIQQKKTVYFAGPSMLTTASGEHYQNFLIESASGINTAGESRGGWASISIEQLLKWNPDLIFIGNYGTARVGSFTGDSRLSDVAAVRRGNVFMSRFYIGSWDVPTPESILGIMWLAGKLYPEHIRFNMAEEMTYFYSTFYGYTPSSDEIEAVLAE
ncbi:MAG: ABC transporter substrate-binding protein [Desulfobacterales bacterium]|nr:ABC transporter substrate-binding protein [Desulfobacterales bacterium]MDD4073140.1 ABC transporter substrate-binding protein [Desulfobacterales bacterium]MDD4393596.1 ABC transporter substrate-binding protein [Desulfobacterales bacterium]